MNLTIIFMDDDLLIYSGVFQKTYLCPLIGGCMHSVISGREKKQAVESMFDSIAWRYDFLNHFLSFGTDRTWRKKAIEVIGKHCRPRYILDVATGTADLALAALKLGPEKITGIDLSDRMLEIGRSKISKLGLEGKIELLKGDAEKIAFGDGHFDVAMVAFGVRNFGNPPEGLREMARVLKPGGIIMVLEFSKPAAFPFRQVYNLYFLNVLPFFGRLFSRDRRAYRYLPESVLTFPDNQEFLKLMEDAGFISASQKRLTGGIAAIYTGIKP